MEHGWDIDLDDGSSNYEIYNNIAIHGGIKLREGFRRIVTNNLVSKIGLHMWFNNSEDQIKRNIIYGFYYVAYTDGRTFPWTTLTTSIDYNVIVVPSYFTQYQANGPDQNSINHTPKFMDAEAGDFRVLSDSPAITLGFVNFLPIEFGVKSPRLRARAEATPIRIPERLVE